MHLKKKDQKHLRGKRKRPHSAKFFQRQVYNLGWNSSCVENPKPILFLPGLLHQGEIKVSGVGSSAEESPDKEEPDKDLLRLLQRFLVSN